MKAIEIDYRPSMQRGGDIVTYGGFVPHILVDAFPGADWDEDPWIYTPHSTPEGNVFWLSNVVEDARRFYFEDYKNRRGFGGATTSIKTDSGGRYALEGPWTSRCSVANMYAEHDLVTEAVLYDNYKSWMKGFTGQHASVCVRWLHEAMRVKTPGWGLEIVERTMIEDNGNEESGPMPKEVLLEVGFDPIPRRDLSFKDKLIQYLDDWEYGWARAHAEGSAV